MNFFPFNAKPIHFKILSNRYTTGIRMKLRSTTTDACSISIFLGRIICRVTTNVKSISYSVIQVKGTHAYHFENDHCCLGLRLVMLRLRELVRRSPVGPCSDVSTLLYILIEKRTGTPVLYCPCRIRLPALHAYSGLP